LCVPLNTTRTRGSLPNLYCEFPHWHGSVKGLNSRICEKATAGKGEKERRWNTKERKRRRRKLAGEHH